MRDGGGRGRTLQLCANGGISGGGGGGNSRSDSNSIISRARARAGVFARCLMGASRGCFHPLLGLHFIFVFYFVFLFPPPPPPPPPPPLLKFAAPSTAQSFFFRRLLLLLGSGQVRKYRWFSFFLVLGLRGGEKGVGDSC